MCFQIKWRLNKHRSAPKFGKQATYFPHDELYSMLSMFCGPEKDRFLEKRRLGGDV